MLTLGLSHKAFCVYLPISSKTSRSFVDAQPHRKKIASLVVPGLCCLALTVGVMCANVIPHDLLGFVFGAPVKAPASAQNYWVGRFFMWDSDWYDNIARYGYTWHRGASEQENVAFFPLWPIVIRMISYAAGNLFDHRTCIFGFTVAVGFVSIFAFYKLAQGILPPVQAKWAVAFYALCPAANFLFRSYPVGLINLLTVLCLHELLKRRYWVAAALSGLASAAGPLAICLSLAVIIAATLEADPEWIRNHILNHFNALALMWLAGGGGCRTRGVA